MKVRHGSAERYNLVKELYNEIVHFDNEMMSVIDRVDALMITVECEQKDLDKVQPILDVGFSNHTPTHMNFICKNRGGGWKGVVVWTKMDLDINKIDDCFVTDVNYKLIDRIEPIELINMK